MADRLGIAHYVIDAEARFRAAVMEDFADGYAAGETPVPCVRCNQSVKFADLTRLAAELGAERLATGHYVRRVDGPDGPELHRAADPARDQSYFLFATTRDQLGRAMFPLGDMADKAAVRAEAARMGLDVAAKPDSQDICFVPAGSYASVVGRMRPDAVQPGEIVSEDGEVLGRHQGIAHYTVGQAKRLGGAQSGSARRVVVGLDPAMRRVVVGAPQTGARLVRLREVNWLVPPRPLRCTVKLRAREVLEASGLSRGAEVVPTPGGADVLLDEAALAAPGQACVFYDGGRVLGGGFIGRPGRG